MGLKKKKIANLKNSVMGKVTNYSFTVLTIFDLINGLKSLFSIFLVSSPPTSTFISETEVFKIFKLMCCNL